MLIKVNGDPREFAAPLTVLELAQRLQLDPKQVAIERNCEIVPRACYPDVMVGDGDAIEIVHFIGGG